MFIPSVEEEKLKFSRKLKKLSSKFLQIENLCRIFKDLAENLINIARTSKIFPSLDMIELVSFTASKSCRIGDSIIGTSRKS
ncbi:hypothetical protein BpHYR1_004376 [Brachionus plicatilis]|uniref:Uncharacterized protein n=1 Tax=Brachionus plicatilis TaxID=10195 RepID=A0A3M7Q480_BRAPC|nr:hypothetical protein BpHYR1_004376 [Brachionus plicatilis]